MRGDRPRGRRQGKARRGGGWSGRPAWKMHKRKGPPAPPGRGAAAARQVSLYPTYPAPPAPPEELSHLRHRFSGGPHPQGNPISNPR